MGEVWFSRTGVPDRTVYTAVAGKDIISASFAALLRFPWRPGTHIHCPETDEGIENLQHRPAILLNANLSHMSCYGPAT